MAIRVLDVVNFSNRRNPQADSGLQLQRELIQAILDKRRDFFFYLLVPRELEQVLTSSFADPHVQLIACDLVSRQQGGTYHFNVRELSGLLDLTQRDVDVLFINQPEVAPAFLELFNKVHFFDIHSFNYVHWMDWKRRDNTKNRWNLPGTLSILTSILVSHVTGCNSRYGKERILREAAKWFNAATLEEMDGRLVPLWPGINAREILAARTRARHRVKTIIFPCRAQKYTGFKSLVETHLASLWKRRRDFRLALTNPSDYDYVKHYGERFPFVEVWQLDRAEYLRALWMADIVVGSHNGANQWSLAVAEAIAAEAIPILNQASFFPEMLFEAMPPSARADLSERYLYYRQNFTTKLEALLDNLEEEKKRVRSLSRRFREFYDWTARVDDWIRCFEAADGAAAEIASRTNVVRKIERLVETTSPCSKKAILEHLGWHVKSRHISWNKYRKYLRRRFHEDALSPTVVFAARKQTHRPGRRAGRRSSRADAKLTMRSRSGTRKTEGNKNR